MKKTKQNKKCMEVDLYIYRWFESKSFVNASQPEYMIKFKFFPKFLQVCIITMTASVEMSVKATADKINNNKIKLNKIWPH